MTEDAQPPEDAACASCKAKATSRVVKSQVADGTWRVWRQCRRCRKYADGGGHWLPHPPVEEMEALPTVKLPAYVAKAAESDSLWSEDEALVEA